MKNLFVPYELAVKLKEKGFNERCFTYWHPKYLDPTIWTLNYINGGISFSDSEQNDSHKSGFTGYKNSIPLHYGLESVAAPVWQQVIDWLRENHGIIISISSSLNSEFYNITSYGITENGRKISNIFHEQVFAIDEFEEHKTYYSALQSGIEKALELI